MIWYCFVVSVSAKTTRTRRDPLLQGIYILVVFGFGWSVVGATGIGGVVVLAVAVIAAIVVGMTAIRARTGGTSQSRPRRRSLPNAAAGFFWVNIAQTVLILVSVSALVKLGVPALVPVAVCLVVGLHFLPLARFFGQPQYWWTGALLVIVAADGGAWYAAGSTAAVIRMAVGIPAAVVLWVTALHLAKRG